MIRPRYQKEPSDIRGIMTHINILSGSPCPAQVILIPVLFSLELPLLPLPNSSPPFVSSPSPAQRRLFFPPPEANPELAVEAAAELDPPEEEALPNILRHWSKESSEISNVGAEVGGSWNSKVWKRIAGTNAVADMYQLVIIHVVRYELLLRT